ncbi:siphovirus Gp157 family protein [Hyphomonas sp.]|uniref:siphovirus Gp157 family protein n=1 Tax=Hyphomonas sp. TaxID=87 RepID=UPI0030032CE6
MADGVDTKINREIEAARALKLALGADADDEELLAGMVEGETSLFEMASVVVDSIARDQELIDGIVSREGQLKERKERIRHRQNGRKAKLEQALMVFGQRKMELAEATLSLSARADKMVITDESQIPSQFWKRGDPVLDKAGLKAHLKALGPDDGDVPGVMLEPSPDTITIRRK